MKIYVQVLRDKTKPWEEVPHKEVDVPDPDSYGITVAARTRCAVRITKPLGNIKPSQLSGSYFRPE